VLRKQEGTFTSLTREEMSQEQRWLEADTGKRRRKLSLRRRKQRRSLQKERKEEDKFS